MLTILKKYFRLPKKDFTVDNVMKTKSIAALDRLERGEEQQYIEEWLAQDNSVLIQHLLVLYGEDAWFQSLFLKHKAAKKLIYNNVLLSEKMPFSRFLFENFLAILRDKSTSFQEQTLILRYFDGYIEDIFEKGLHIHLSESDFKVLVLENPETFNLCEQHGCLTDDIIKVYLYHLKTVSKTNEKTLYFYEKPYMSMCVKQKCGPLSNTELNHFKKDLLIYFNQLFTIYYDELEQDRRDRQLYRLRSSYFIVSNILEWFSHNKETVFFENIDSDKDFINKCDAFLDCYLKIETHNATIKVILGELELTNIDGFITLLKNLPLKVYNRHINPDIQIVLEKTHPELSNVPLVSAVYDDNAFLYTLLLGPEHTSTEEITLIL